MQPLSPHLITEYELRDKNGNIKRTYRPPVPKLQPDKVIINVMTASGIIKKHIERPFQSWVANFTRMLNYGWMQVANKAASSANDIIYTHVTGGAGVLTADAYHCKVDEAALAPAAPNVFGIMIGDMDNSSGLGLTVESGIGNILHYSDYMLRTLILNDGGAPNTDVEHRAVNVSMPDDETLLISRKFQNDAATTLYVDECCLVGQETDNTEEFMIARDILGTENDPSYLTVPTTEIIEINYTFTVTDASGLTSNWLKYLSSIFTDALPVASMKDINNSAQATANPAAAQTNQNMAAAQDDDTFGIVIGGWLSGGSGFSPSPFTTDYYQIPFKLLDSEIDYGPMVEIAIDLESEYTQFGMYRDFENDNATTAYVNSSGLYMKEAALTRYFLMAATIVSGDPNYITVLPDEILRVKKFMKFNL